RSRPHGGRGGAEGEGPPRALPRDRGRPRRPRRRRGRRDRLRAGDRLERTAACHTADRQRRPAAIGGPGAVGRPAADGGPHSRPAPGPAPVRLTRARTEGAMTDDREYFTYVGAAAFTSLSVRSLCRAVDAGRLPALRAAPTGSSGRPRVVFRRRDLIAFMESAEPVVSAADRAAALIDDLLGRRAPRMVR